MDQGRGGTSGRGQASYRGDRPRGGGRSWDSRRRQGGGRGSSNVVKAKGIPYDTKETKLAEFFAEYDVSIFK